MFKLMIADDNNYILQDLCQSTDWERFDFDLIGAYSDGQELLIAANAEIPDVVITDIAMPIMNGFQLASSLYELNPQIKIIFISSYSEFEYAKNALKLHVFDYLIKPIKNTQLTEVMTRVLIQLQQEQDQQLHQLETKSQLAYFRQAALSNYLSRLLFHSSSEEQIRRELHSMGLVLPKPFELYVVCFKLNQMPDTEKPILSDSSLYSITDIDRTNSHLIPLITDRNQGALLLIYNNHILSVPDILARFCIDAETKTKLDITIGYSEPSNHFTELSRLYKQAYTTLKQLIIMDTDIPIASYNDIHTEKDNPENNVLETVQYSECVAVMRTFIHENYMNPINTADVAKTVFLSSGYANLCFTNECNISIFGYIIWYRLKIAKQLLTETDTHVTRIAELIGYSSKTSFYLAFKRSTGISPTEYRQKYASLMNQEGNL